MKPIPQPKTLIKVEDPSIPKRIENLLSLSELTEWEKTFLSAIGKYYKAWNYLSSGQYKTLCEVEKRNTPAARQERADWIAAWDDNKQKIFDRALRVYADIPNYYKNIKRAVENNPDWIPSKKDYIEMCCNKYMQRILKLESQPPKFPVGTLVIYDKTYHNWLGTVVGHHEYFRADPGARYVDVYFFPTLGNVYSHDKETVSERLLTFYRGNP